MSTIGRSPYSVGIFAEAEERAVSMGNNLFLSCMLSQSLETYEKTKKEYEEAVQSEADEQELKQKEMMFKASIMSIQMATDMFTHYEEESSD